MSASYTASRVQWPVSMAIAGAMILAVHQPLVWLLHWLSLTPWRGFDLAPVGPWRVPAAVSAVFWGSLWGPIIVRLSRFAQSRRRHAYAALGTAVLTTLAGGALMLLGRGDRIPASHAVTAVAASLLINGVWSLTTSIAVAKIESRSDVHTTS